MRIGSLVKAGKLYQSNAILLVGFFGEGSLDIGSGSYKQKSLNVEAKVLQLEMPDLAQTFCIFMRGMVKKEYTLYLFR